MTNVDDAHSDLLLGDRSSQERADRLAVGAIAVAGRPSRTSLLSHPRFLMGVASLLMTTGMLAIVLGWVGASRSIRTQEQIPYLISGGLLGVALAVVGALTLFTHWLTVLVRDNRRHHTELLEALREATAPKPQEVRNASARGKQSQRPLRGDASSR